MQTRSRHGFTLVELLVVITIIGILVSLLFPTLSALREHSRKITCSRNLAKIGVALQGYEDANCVYPSGTINPQGPIHNRAEGIEISWIVQILPYLDEKVAFNKIEQAAGAYDAKNAPVRALRIAGLICPSETNAVLSPLGFSSYAGNHNDLESPIDADNHGVFFLNSKITPKDITDGLTHTIFVGEKRTGMGDLGWISGTNATLRNGGSFLNSTEENRYNLPVNASAKTDPATETTDLWVGGFGSGHTNGSHFLFGDGAVRFVDNAISLKVLQTLCNRADGELVTNGPTRSGQ
jgi:prepilin-type N-terminal cleavage/methylation domain-containing protein